jgi:hypothetical protein
LKRFNETIQGEMNMVDMAIAANFVRELTQEQFTPQQRVQRRNAAANRAAKGPDPAQGTSRRSEATRVSRTLARRAQVRG